MVSLHGLFFYWAGRVGDALERSRRGIEVARQSNDLSALLFSLPHLGMSLAASGRYDAAAAVFDEAIRTGREYRIEGFLARAVSMSTGYRLDLFDFAGAEALSNEARELGLSGPFLPAVTSANLDLLFNYVRTGDIGRADGWIDKVAKSLEPVAGFHRWLWAGRLAQVRAELAAAKAQWDETLRASDEAIRQAQASQRVKYQALGLEVRARAHRGLGHDGLAIRDLNAGLALARALGDPAVFLRLATALLAFDGDEALDAEARLTMERVLAALPGGETRRAFVAAASPQLLRR